MLRIILSIILLLSPALLPWWLILICGIILCVVFDTYFEFIILGVILDSLYGERFEIFHTTFVFTLANLVIYFLISKIRKNLRY